MSTDVRMLLRDDVAGVGKKGDIVVVSPGYARNFLVPRGLALAATNGVEAQAEAMRRKRMLKDAKDRESAQEIAKVLVPKVINVSARAGEGGKLFGSITANEIVAAVRVAGGHRARAAHRDARRAHQDDRDAPRPGPSPPRGGVPGDARGRGVLT